MFITLDECPQCGGTDLDRGTREGTLLIGCADCGWPAATADEISIGQAWDEAHTEARRARQAAVGCGCGLDMTNCEARCGCACHWVPVH